MTNKRFAVPVVNEGFVDDEGKNKDGVELSTISVDGPIPPKKVAAASKKEILMLWKNVIVVIIASALVLIGLYADLALIGSIVVDTQLVFITLTLMAIVELSCIFTPIFMTKIGSRNSLILAYWMISIYLASMFFPAYWSLIPGALFLGIGWPLQWNAVNTYMKDLAVKLSTAMNTDLDVLLVRIFGAVGVSYQCGIVIGNLIVFFILDSGPTHKNETSIADTLQICGGNYCNEDLETEANVKIPESWRVLCLNGILTGCGVVGSLLLLAADKVSSDSENERNLKMSQASKGSFLENCKTAMLPFRQAMALWKNPRQLLMFPYCFYLGLEVPFYLTDFTKAFISCPLGIPYIGIAMACLGGANMLFCLIQGNLVRWFGRLPVIVFGAVIHITAMIIGLSWKLDDQHVYIYFVLSAMLGVADAVVFTQGYALCGIVYDKNTDLVYSNCIFVTNIAFMVAYIYSFLLCVYIKIYIMAGTLLLSIICLVSLERIHKRSKS